ncbi:hypothetical protein AS034_02055 [[Bacillus] enclensis]|uniref:Mbeg1-like protein n=1 Tax=[Bacillus] enclensis TaxID=1402860 RepID=UPI00071E5DD2|nr:Mbeg1-like protein [[Bacillus] enclensis]KSU64642.1 hypothetical protein AS034_02055 [[Bacillus] enclensis]
MKKILIVCLILLLPYVLIKQVNGSTEDACRQEVRGEPGEIVQTALKFSHLAYADFDDPSSVKGKPVASLFDSHEELDITFSEFNDALEEKGVNDFSEGLEDWYVLNADGDKGSFWSSLGFWGAAFIKEDTLIVSFRGTDDTSSISYDLAAVVLQTDVSTQVNQAKEFMNAVKEQAEAKGIKEVYLTGHSLGGFLVQKVILEIEDGKLPGYSMDEKKGALKVSGGITFNAPGFKNPKGPHLENLISEKQFNNNCGFHVENYIVSEDLVGNYGRHIGVSYYLDGQGHAIAGMHNSLGKAAESNGKPLIIALADGTFSELTFMGIAGEVLNEIGMFIPFLILLFILINLFRKKFSSRGFGSLINYIILWGVVCLIVYDLFHNFALSASLASLFILVLWILVRR